MTEINQIKREYAKNFKYSWVDNASESALRSTNLQNWVREWQFKLANENWFTNLAEINKNTQGWKAYADMLWSEVAWKQWNNTISLTDWVSLSWWNPTNISMFLWKQVWKLPKVQRSAMKFFWKQTKNPILEAQVSKVDDLIENVSSKNVNFWKSWEKIINQKIPTTWSQVASQDVLKIRNNLENVAKKYDVDLSDISLTNNEFRNSLNILSKVNRSFPKGLWIKNDLAKQMYQDKVDSVIDLIKFVRKEKNLWKDIDYIWGYDNIKKMPFILFKEWKWKNKFIKSYHMKEKEIKQIKAIVK